jgi:hypothetical protein
MELYLPPPPPTHPHDIVIKHEDSFIFTFVLLLIRFNVSYCKIYGN